MIYIDKIRPGEDVGVNGSKGAMEHEFLLENSNGSMREKDGQKCGP